MRLNAYGQKCADLKCKPMLDNYETVAERLDL